MRIGDHDTGSQALDRIIAIRPGALGDALLLFPTLALLRRAFPSTSITLVARPDVLPLAHASSLANATSSYDDPRWSAVFSDSPNEDSSARDLLAGTTTLAWLVDSWSSVARNLETLGARQAFTLPPLPLADSPEHIALHLSRALTLLGVEAPSSITALGAAMPPLAPPDEDERRARDVWKQLGLADSSTSVVAIHPGSGGAAKRWPPERFAELASSIRQMEYIPLLLEGPQDVEVADIVVERARGTVRRTRDLSIGSLATLLQRCKAYVGNDSGVTHLAGMLGIRTLALFGPTDPARWAPLGPYVQIIRAEDGRMESLSAPEVAVALASLLQD